MRMESTAVRVHPMVVAEMTAPPNYWDRGGRLAPAMARALATPRSRWMTLPIPAFLVEHPTEGPILVDTGFDASVATDRRATFGRAMAAMFPVRMSPERAVPEQLRARGIDPEDVRTVVMTHLHFDHASGMGPFAGATFVADRREWEAAQRGGLLEGYRPSMLEPATDRRSLDLAAEGERHGPFAHTRDLLGDGSVRLLATPGHTHGHLSVLCRLADGPLLLTGDAAYARRTIEEGWVPLTVTGDEADYRSSLDAIATWTREHPDATVICGHDPWSRDALERSYG